MNFFVKHFRFASKSMQQEQRHKTVHPNAFFGSNVMDWQKKRRMLRNALTRVTGSSRWWCFMNSECCIAQERNHSREHEVKPWRAVVSNTHIIGNYIQLGQSVHADLGRGISWDGIELPAVSMTSNAALKTCYPSPSCPSKLSLTQSGKVHC